MEIKWEFIILGSVDVLQNATFTAPKLTSTGSVYVHSTAKILAPNLKR